MSILYFCAAECQLHRTGEISVYWMVNAWDYVKLAYPGYDMFEWPHFEMVGSLCAGVTTFQSLSPESRKNIDLQNLLKAKRNISHQAINLEIWYEDFLEANAFGSAAVTAKAGKIYYNYLKETMDEPEWPESERLLP